MKLSKKVLIASAMMIACGFVFAQTSQVQKKNNSETETSVESEYLNDVDGDIIMQLVDSDDFDSKLVALEFLSNALEDGNTSDSVIQALDRLAGEGLTTQARTNGRLMAQVPTEHSKNTLISIAIADNEPMVIAAACKSLGEIGINENDEAIKAIAFANKRNRILNPTSSLALEVLNAFELLYDSSENKKTMIEEVSAISSDYHYVTPVRQKAYNLLKKLSSTTSKKSDNKKKSSSSSNEVNGD